MDDSIERFRVSKRPEVVMTERTHTRGVSIKPSDITESTSWLEFAANVDPTDDNARVFIDGNTDVVLDITEICAVLRTECPNNSGRIPNTCALGGQAVLAAQFDVPEVSVAIEFSCTNRPGSRLDKCSLLESSDEDFGNRMVDVAKNAVSEAMKNAE